MQIDHDTFSLCSLFDNAFRGFFLSENQQKCTLPPCLPWQFMFAWVSANSKHLFTPRIDIFRLNGIICVSPHVCRGGPRPTKGLRGNTICWSPFQEGSNYPWTSLEINPKSPSFPYLPLFTELTFSAPGLLALLALFLPSLTHSLPYVMQMPYGTWTLQQGTVFYKVGITLHELTGVRTEKYCVTVKPRFSQVCGE